MSASPLAGGPAPAAATAAPHRMNGRLSAPTGNDMIAAAERKEFFTGLIEVLSQALSHDLLDDAEAVLLCARVLRPRLAELDTFEAWIAIRRRNWQDAQRFLAQLDSALPDSEHNQALLAFCQFSMGDERWRDQARVIVDNSKSQAAVDLMQLMLDPAAAKNKSRPAVPPEETVRAAIPEFSCWRA